MAPRAEAVFAALPLALAACAAIAGRPRAWSDGVVEVTWTRAGSSPDRTVLRDGSVRALASRISGLELELRTDADGDGRLGAGDDADVTAMPVLFDDAAVRFGNVELPEGTLCARLRVTTRAGSVSVVDLLR